MTRSGRWSVASIKCATRRGFLLLAVFGLFKGAFLSYCGALAKINFGLDMQ